MRVRNQVAIVTGAASGIGRGIALAFAGEGAKVAIADLNLEGAEAVAGEIRDAGGQAIGVAMDVTDEAAVDAGVERIASELGGVHVLVSNAGVQMIGPLHELPFETWQKMLAIHLDGAFLTTRACLRSTANSQPWRTWRRRPSSSPRTRATPSPGSRSSSATAGAWNRQPHHDQ